MTKIVKVFLLLSIVRTVTPRRRPISSASGESIENLLYYQDCKHSTAPPSTALPEKLKLENPKPSCPYPKMCCAMSCNNEPCVSEQLNGFGNQIRSNLEPMSRMPNRFEANQPFLRARKKKFRQPLQNSGRRDFGFTKDNIKSLISQDNDIRKILKDLVRVTMQKVDLQEMINSRRAELVTSTTTDIPEYMADDL